MKISFLLQKKDYLSATIEAGQLMTSESTSSSVEKQEAAQLLRVYPNPSSEGFQLSFQITERSDVRVELYSTSGVKIRTLLSREQLTPGEHTFSITRESLAPGLYFVRLLTDNGEAATSKLVVN